MTGSSEKLEPEGTTTLPPPSLVIPVMERHVRFPSGLLNERTVTMLARKRFLAGVPTDVVFHVRGVERAVLAETAEQHVAVQRRRYPLPDARHAFHPRHYRLTK
jgi:hypothetical protein